MLHPNHCIYAQTQRSRPNDTPPYTSSHPAPTHYEALPHPEVSTPSLNHLNPINTTLDILNKQRHRSLSSSSEEAEDAHQTSDNGWQIIRRTKRKKHATCCSDEPNRNTKPLWYTHTGSPSNRTRRTISTTKKKNHKPPPIFLHSPPMTKLWIRKSKENLNHKTNTRKTYKLSRSANINK